MRVLFSSEVLGILKREMANYNIKYHLRKRVDRTSTPYGEIQKEGIA